VSGFGGRGRWLAAALTIGCACGIKAPPRPPLAPGAGAPPSTSGPPAGGAGPAQPAAACPTCDQPSPRSGDEPAR
jgi:hypothetical protein